MSSLANTCVVSLLKPFDLALGVERASYFCARRTLRSVASAGRSRCAGGAPIRLRRLAYLETEGMEEAIL